MAIILDDLRSAVRYLRRRPMFALAVSATLAVGIAVTASAYGVARAVLWRPLPFDAPDRLVFVWEEPERDGRREPARVTGSRFAAWQQTDSGFASLALFGGAGFTIETPQGATSVRGVRVTANYFETLGLRPALGRTFRAEEQQPGQHRVVILSDHFWRERFGARSDAVGQTLRLSGENYQIVGVMPRGTFPAWAVNPATVTLDPGLRQVWVPIQWTAALAQSGRAHVFGVVGRLAPGISAAQAVERLRASTDPAAVDAHMATAEPLREQFVRDARTPLLALAASALVALLIACANLAALYASAFESRRAELAVRAALGAGVPRLARQLVVEALLLAGIGASTGLVLARGALAVIPGLLPPAVPFLTVPAVDFQVTVAATGLALVATGLFTAWPVMRLVGGSTLPRGTAPRSRGTLHRALVVSQVALTMGLAPAAALLARSLRTVERQDTGFAVEQVLVANVGVRAGLPPSAELVSAAERDVLAAVAALPNVRAVAAAYDHPLEANWSENPTVLGDSSSPDDSRQAELRIVSPGYFEALDIDIVEGRSLSDRDRFDSPGVALVNEAFARELGGRVVGRRLQSGTPRFTYGAAAPNVFEIVGIVANERFRGLERPSQPAFYLSTRQFPQSGFTLLVRTGADPLTAAPDVRSAIRGVNEAITFDSATSLSRILAEQLASRRITTTVIVAFAIAGIALAALGLYGLLTVLVGTRLHEIGVRLALGASPLSVARRVVRDSMRTASIGIACGVALSFAATRLIRHLLVGVTPGDVLTLAGTMTALLTIALLAAWLPAKRAAQTDPALVLRSER